uniref:Uncharacterized protein n=1 Tax=Ignisphaera aggregans TaxID=334771 RepID=A0A7C2ZBK8_9CREN
MLLGSGTLIESIESRVKSLERVLRDYIAKSFTGYVIYRNDVQGTYVSIAIVEGRITLCRAIEGGIVYEGPDCCDAAMRILNVPEGVIEIYSASLDIIVLDQLLFPLSRVERRTGIIPVIGAEIGLPAEAVTIAEAPTPASAPTPPPTPVVVESQQPSPQLKVEVKPAEEQVQVEEMEKAVASPPPPQPPSTKAGPEHTITISEECVDPVVLYTVLRSAQLLEHLPAVSSLDDVLGKVKTVAFDKKPSYIYVSASIETATLRLVYTAADGVASIEIEKEGSVVCGSNAIKDLASKPISNVKIWYIP